MPHARVDDAELVERVRHRDREACRALFDRHYPRVYGFVRRRVPDDGLAEEVVADVFFEIWRSANDYRGDGKLLSWIFGIAHFQCLRALRKRQRERRWSVLPSRTELAARTPDPRDPERTLAAREQLRRVQRQIASLPDGQRQTVELAVIDGLDYREIADRLGVSEGTVKARVSRAREQLRDRVRRGAALGEQP